MEGLNQHLHWQIKLAGGKVGAEQGSGSGGGGSRHSAMPDYQGSVPDDIPDIAGMIPIEKQAD